MKPADRKEVTLPSAFAESAYIPMMWPEGVYAGRILSLTGERIKLKDLPVSTFDSPGHREYFTKEKES